MKQFNAGGRTFSVQWNGSALRLDGQEHSVSLERTGPSVWMTRSGKRIIAVRRENRIFLHADGTTYILDVASPGRAAAAGHAAGDHGLEIAAPMTGRVVKVCVSLGDAVPAGETVAIVEAMKMEHRLTAPRNARVREIKCKAGDLVDGGRLLVSLEEDGSHVG